MWQTVFTEDFTGLTLDLTRWEPSVGLRTANHAQTYMTARPENLRIANGLLTLTGLPDPYLGAPCTSALVRATDALVSHIFGAIEFRFKVNLQLGAVGSLWAVGELGGWPQHGEIDLEIVKRFPGVAWVGVHAAKLDGSHWAWIEQVPFPEDGQWHTGQFKILPDRVVIVLDGSDIYQLLKTSLAADETWPFDQYEFRPIISQELGTDFTGPLDPAFTRSEVVVDAVHIERWVADSTPPSTPGGTMVLTPTLTGRVLTFTVSADVQIGAAGSGKCHLHISKPPGMGSDPFHVANLAPFALGLTQPSVIVDLVDSTHVLVNNQHYVLTVGSTPLPVPPPSSPAPVGTFTAKWTGKVIVLADVPATTQLEANTTLQQMLGKGLILSLEPLP